MTSRQMEQRENRGMPQHQSQVESTSVIDQYSNFDGTYNSSRDLRVEGQVKGTIVCKGTLHVAQGANVKANIEAENISVAGELEGEITCRGRLELLQNGRVKGRISTQSLVIHEGAVYEGDMEMGGTAARSRRARAAERQQESSPLADSPVPAPALEAERQSPPQAPEPEAEVPTSRPNSFIRRFGNQDQPSVETPEDQ